MILCKIWTTQYERYARAAYAESNEVYIDLIMAEIRVLMADPLARFYKVEIKENGAYVGYFIIKGNVTLNLYVRPHFSAYLPQLGELIAEVANDPKFAGSVASDNIKSE